MSQPSDPNDFAPGVLVSALSADADVLQAAQWTDHWEKFGSGYPIDSVEQLTPLIANPPPGLRTVTLEQLRAIIPAGFFKVLNQADFATKILALIRLAHVVPDVAHLDKLPRT